MSEVSEEQEDKKALRAATVRVLEQTVFDKRSEVAGHSTHVSRAELIFVPFLILVAVKDLRY